MSSMNAESAHRLRGAALCRSPREPVGTTPLTGSFSSVEMDFVLVHAKYDANTGRAYVEFRGPSDGAGDAIVAAIFSYKNTGRLSKVRMQEEIVRKARYLLKKVRSCYVTARTM